MQTMISDAQAEEAMRAHHAEMRAALRERVDALTAAVEAGTDHRAAHAAVLDYLHNDLLPHAAAEEKALYPAGQRGELASLVQAMIAEHGNIIAHVERFATIDEPVRAVGIASAIAALFETHLAKETDQLIPHLVADPGVALGELLGGMHELLGERS